MNTNNLIPQAFLDDLLSKTDLVALIDTRVPLKQAGKNFLARCPFHTEKSPSFSVSREKQFYHCFGCGVSGNAISFLMDYERQTFVEAVESLADFLGVEVPKESASSDQRGQKNAILPLYEIQEQAAEFYARQLLAHPEAKRARDYLAQRGLSEEIIQRFKLGYAPPGWRNLPEAMPADRLLGAGLAIAKDSGGFYDRFRDRIMFPIRDRRGRVVGFGGRVMGEETPKYLNSPETPTFKKHREVYGLYELLATRQKPARIVVVEGYMDVIALAQFGIHNVVATLGTALSADHLALLFRYAKQITFCFDGDTAGQAAAWKALETAMPLLQPGRAIRFLTLPESQDPDSYIRQHGPDVFQKRLLEASYLSEYLFQQLEMRHDPVTLENRAQYYRIGNALISKIPDINFKNLLMCDLYLKTGYYQLTAELKKVKTTQPTASTAKT